jgi:hypothetical protein
VNHKRIFKGIMLCAIATGLSLAWAETGVSQPTLLWQGPDKEAQEAQAFCSAPGPRDYAEPLADLPPITELPAKRKGIIHLPFGPKNLGVYTLSPSVVLVNGGLYGYGLYDRDFSDSSLSLNWRISVQLQSLTGAGLVEEEIDEDTVEVGSFTPDSQPQRKLEVPESVGFYRVDVQFATKTGEALGSYSEYLRVMRPTIHVRLGINHRQFRHNQILAFRLENVGTARIGYGSFYWFARKTPKGWKGVEQLNQRSFDEYYAFAGAGEAGRCTSFRIPQNLLRGLYRVSKVVGITEDGKTFKGRRPSAEFRITDPPRG